MAGDICMVESQTENLQKVEDSLKNLKDETPEVYNGTYLFFSFDLVNSTAFKSKNQNWGKIFDRFFTYCKNQMRDEFPRVLPWKMIGDEILFYLQVASEEELYESPQKSFAVLGKCIEFINQEDQAKSHLSVKATIWVSVVFDSIDRSTTEYANIIIRERNYGEEVLDFLGPDIDIGFRISRYAHNGILVIEAKLACLLTKLKTNLKDEHISKYMRIVSFEKLKGVWTDRYYPIVWYRDNWTYSDAMFVYDDRFNSEIVAKIVETKGSSLIDVSRLTSIFIDLNRTNEIEDIQKHINHDEKNIAGRIPRDRLSELHIVAICVNSKNEILVAKRTEKDTLPNTWEFGCGQLHINQDFISAINEGYKNDFGITLEFIGNNSISPNSIGTYIVKKPKENDRIVPGIIFVCKVISGEDAIDSNLDKLKHSKYKFVNKESYKELLSESLVPDFEKRILDTYSLLEQQEESSNAR
jgi:hypothetical protein